MKINHPLTSTTIATATTVNLFEKCDLIDGRLPSFTFENQKKFKFIEIVSCYIDSNIQRFRDIWPLLGAYTKNNSWDLKLDEDLEFIGVAHYTILKSLSYIYQNKDAVVMNDSQQKFKNTIFHYALIIDCIKQISFHIVKFKMKLNPESKFPTTKLSRNSFLKKMEDWYDNEYKDRFDNFLNNGVLVMKEFHSAKDCISSLNKNKKFRSFYKFNEIITPYRNIFIHNPSIDIFNRGGKPYVVRSEYIKTNRTIQNISKLNPKDMINPKELMDDLFRKATNMLSDVWTVFFQEIETINTDSNFLSRRLNYT
jgi:hypothetical protein